MFKIYSLRGLLTPLLFFCGLPMMVAATITVTSTADNADEASPGTLRQAVADAASGDTIRFDASTNGTTIFLDEEIITLNKNLTIIGNGMSNTIIDASGNSRIFRVTTSSTVKIMGLTVQNGNAPSDGGGIRVRTGSSLTLRNVTIQNCIARGAGATNGGGGISTEGALFLNRCLITGNTATVGSGSGGGVLVRATGSLEAYNSSITNNTANRAGGGIEDASGSPETGDTRETYLRNTFVNDNTVNTSPGNGGGIHAGAGVNLNIRLGQVSGNTAGSEGGGIWLGSGMLTVRGTLVDGNEALGADADQGGGGLYNDGGMMIVNPDTRITNNVASGASGSGGGILNNDGGRLRVNDATIRNNIANRAGGGIEDASGDAAISVVINARIDSNTVNTSPGNGGGIHVGGDASMMVLRGTVRGNVAGSEGGGLWNGLGTMTVRGTLVEGNTATGADATQGGGGIYNDGGTLRVNPDTRIAGNAATGASGSGGGILNAIGGPDGAPSAGTLFINDATIFGNTAMRAGGGIEDASGQFSRFFVINARIDSNVVMTSPGNGGGIHVGGDGSLQIVRTSVRNNIAGSEGGGLWNGMGTTTISGGTYSGNSAPDGGALYNDGGDIVLDRGTVVSDNSATGEAGSGGGLFGSGGSVTARQAIFSGNTANRAGGAVEIANGEFISIDSDYDGNATGNAPGNGGAFHITAMSGFVSFMGGTVTNNTAANEGGGIWNQSGVSMTIENVSIMNNTVTNDSPAEGQLLAGGGVYNNGGTLTINSSTIDSNSVVGDGAGGGLVNSGVTGVLSVFTSTIARNSAATGGGIANVATTNVQNSTITDNTATVAGGGVSQGVADFDGTNSVPSLVLEGSVLSANTAPTGQDVSLDGGDIVSNGYNFLGTEVSNSFTVDANDIVGDDPQLGELMDNGGMTMTYQPECGSQLIGNGNPDVTTPDQIGQDIVGTRDIGSFELQAASGCASVVGQDGTTAEARSSEQGKEDVSVYPNPTRERAINVRISDRFENGSTLRVMDVTGRVRQTVSSVASGTYRLSLDNYKSGSYILQLVNGEEVRNVQFMVAD